MMAALLISLREVDLSLSDSELNELIFDLSENDITFMTKIDKKSYHEFELPMTCDKNSQAEYQTVE